MFSCAFSSQRINGIQLKIQTKGSQFKFKNYCNIFKLLESFSNVRRTLTNICYKCISFNYTIDWCTGFNRLLKHAFDSTKRTLLKYFLYQQKTKERSKIPQDEVTYINAVISCT